MDKLPNPHWFIPAVILYTLLWAALCSAAQYTEDQAIRAIIGEAGNQGEQGMLAVACAIRNRGHLKGVYGLNAPHVDKEPDWVWKSARRAWELSLKQDITGGADHWHNVVREGETYWTVKMTKTVCIKDHCFYK